MAQDDDKQRTTRERIERLRERVKQAQHNPVTTTDPQLYGILKAILDLLSDEL